jgi:ADP-ribose pyrophosphatase YjhB (NUDIX family)
VTHDTIVPPWLAWARELQALAQNGLTFSHDRFDIERYERIAAIAGDMLAHHADAPPERCRELFAVQTGYATPKLDVRAVVFQEGKLLFVHERSDGLWTLPGGWVDVGESPSEAVAKEVREESGFDVRAERILALFDRDRHGHPPIAFHTYKLFILCTIVGGAALEHSSETDGVGFFGEDELPPLSVTRVVRSQIARMFEHHRTPGLATDFD